MKVTKVVPPLPSMPIRSLQTANIASSLLCKTERRVNLKINYAEVQLLLDKSQKNKKITRPQNRIVHLKIQKNEL